MKALLYLFLLLGSSVAAAQSGAERPVVGPDMVVDLGCPTPDQEPLPGEPRVVLQTVLLPLPLPHLTSAVATLYGAPTPARSGRVSIRAPPLPV